MVYDESTLKPGKREMLASQTFRAEWYLWSGKVFDRKGMTRVIDARYGHCFGAHQSTLIVYILARIK